MHNFKSLSDYLDKSEMDNSSDEHFYNKRRSFCVGENRYTRFREIAPYLKMISNLYRRRK